MNDAGLCFLPNPARLRRIARARAETAWSWPISALVQAILEVQQLFGLALADSLHRNPGPHLDDLGDILRW